MQYWTRVRNALLLGSLILGITACGSDAPAPHPAGSSGPGNTAASSNSAAPATAQQWDRQIIRTATVNLEVADVETTLNAVRSLATTTNGLVFSSSSQYQGDQQIAAITIQVPADQFDPVMISVRKLGTRVVSETSTSQDVTEEYVDLDSQRKNLQAQADQLRVLMGRAGSVDEILRVQHELSDVEGQIERIEGRLNYLSHRSQFSTITVNLAPKGLEARPGWQPEVTMARAWQASLAVLTTAGDAMLTLVVFCWWVILLLIVAILLIRQRRKRVTAEVPAPMP